MAALAFCVMAPSWKDPRPVVVLVTAASGGGCEFKVGEDVGNAKNKYFRRSAKKDEPIVWQVLNNCGQDIDMLISDTGTNVTSYGGTNGFALERSFPLCDGEGAFGLTLIKDTKKDESICVAVKGNKCPDVDSGVQISRPPAAARTRPGTGEIPGGGAAPVTMARNVRDKRAQIQIDIFP